MKWKYQNEEEKEEETQQIVTINASPAGGGGVTKKEMETLLANASSGPVQTIRIEQAPLKITTANDDPKETFKM